MTFDAIILADSPHADAVLLGLSLVERARRVALRAGAREVRVVRSRGELAGFTPSDELLVIRGGDQLVHHPLPKCVLAGAADKRIAVGPDGEYAGAIFARGESARELVGALAAESDREIAARWRDAERLVHGDIARHAATTQDERRAAVKMLLRILTKADEVVGT